MIRKCQVCGSYTLNKKHCDKKTKSSRPPKFSYPDKYGKFRRKTKKQVNEDNGSNTNGN